jgi:glyoxylase-like metal-dependent hydrolase (beta-lactamase superfamily II)
MSRKIFSQSDEKTFGKVFSLKMRLFSEVAGLLLMISQVVTAQTTLPQPILTPPINGPAAYSTTATQLQTPLKTTDQSDNLQESQQAVVKVEESSFALTPENEAAKKIIVSKVYDAQESAGNSYIVRLDGSDKAVVIDPGYNYEAIVKYLKQINVNVEAILLTNGYFARIAGNEPLRKEWSKATILIGEKDATLLTDTKTNGSEQYGGITSPNANVWLKNDDAFTLAGIPFHVLATPGHTAGSMSYAITADQNGVVFTGDFIYKDGASSAALPTSNEDDLNKSLETFLKTQYAETVIFPGYGANTTVAAFYEQLTGKSVSLLKESENSTDKQSPIIIVERDSGVLPAQTTIVTAPPMAYATTEIIVENYRRPWLNVGVVLPVWSSWYRPWHYYQDRHFYVDILPPIFYSPFYRPHFHGSYYPPLIAPPRPGHVVRPPNFRPPVWIPPRPERPDFGRPPIHGRPGDRPGVGRPNPPATMPTPSARPNPPRPESIRPNPPATRPTPSARPNPPRPESTRPTPSTRPNPSRLESIRPNPPATRPTPSARPNPPRPESIRPNPPATRPTPSARPNPPRPESTRPTPSTRPNPSRPEGRPGAERSRSGNNRQDNRNLSGERSGFSRPASTQSAAASSPTSENRRSGERPFGGQRSGGSRSEKRNQTESPSQE